MESFLDCLSDSSLPYFDKDKKLDFYTLNLLILFFLADSGLFVSPIYIGLAILSLLNLSGISAGVLGTYDTLILFTPRLDSFLGIVS